MGKTMIVASTDKFRPAPLDIHTENVSLLSPANRESAACFHLQWHQHEIQTTKQLQLLTIQRRKDQCADHEIMY